MSGLNKKNSWKGMSEDILSRTGFAYVWLTQGVDLPVYFKREIKERLINNSWQNWSSICSGSNRIN